MPGEEKLIALTSYLVTMIFCCLKILKSTTPQPFIMSTQYQKKCINNGIVIQITYFQLIYYAVFFRSVVFVLDFLSKMKF